MKRYSTMLAMMAAVFGLGCADVLAETASAPVRAHTKELSVELGAT